jgi:hypothetical protein
VIQHQPLDRNDFEVVEAIREHGPPETMSARSTSRARPSLGQCR